MKTEIIHSSFTEPDDYGYEHKDTIRQVLQDVYDRKCSLLLAETRILGIQLNPLNQTKEG
jgi:hypothetical protein